ncbi:MAG: AAA family ATPase [Gammaproteobacteria bacterium]|nr:AAA family ATPase [Gammaproteobacteria bacterium]
MYLEHFKFTELPFTITPNVDFFCNLKGHHEALNTLLFSLRSGEGFIKIIGEVGAGKTLLCRKVLSSLDSHYFTAYIPNPDLNPVELRKALARELGIEPTALQDQHELLTVINNRLLELHAAGKQIVLLIDEAQALPPESLETLRLLTNLETETTKLLQVVLFGQPELDERLNQTNFRQLKQRISFSYYLPLMSREDLDSYLFHRLATAGYTYGTLFTNKARKALYRASNGVPRLVNILCHKALLAAYGQGENKITHKIIRVAVKDTEATHIPDKFLKWIIVGLISLIALILTFYISEGII